MLCQNYYDNRISIMLKIKSSTFNIDAESNINNIIYYIAISIEYCNL